MFILNIIIYIYKYYIFNNYLIITEIKKTIVINNIIIRYNILII